METCLLSGGSDVCDRTCKFDDETDIMRYTRVCLQGVATKGVLKHLAGWVLQDLEGYAPQDQSLSAPASRGRKALRLKRVGESLESGGFSRTWVGG